MQYIFISMNNLKVFDKTVCYIQSFMDYLLLKSNPKELQILFIKPQNKYQNIRQIHDLFNYHKSYRRQLNFVTNPLQAERKKAHVWME